MKSTSKTESYIMHWIWEQERTLTSKEILTHFVEEKGWKQTTISTFLKRLINKDYLTAERFGRTWLYTPVISYSEFKTHESVDVVQKYFGGSLKEFIKSYSSAVDDQKQLDELAAWLKVHTKPKEFRSVNRY